MGTHNPLHCILPPYILEHMASSSDEAVRKLAVENMVTAAEVRSARSILTTMPALSIAAATTAKKRREVYDMKNGPQFGTPRHVGPL